MADNREASRPAGRAYQGDMTPMHAEEATLGPLEQEMRETTEIVRQPSDGRTAADGERPTEERRASGIEDNVRHVDSIGRR